MKQGYEDPAGFTVYRVLIDDTDKTNIIEHLPKACDFIAKARLHSKGVLIHCQAGVSRSTSIVAAYLMREMGLTTEQALHRIRKTRKQAEPSDFFMLQLELFERCDCEWNPTKVCFSLPRVSPARLLFADRVESVHSGPKNVASS